MLYDLTAVDERLRKYRRDLPASDFTVVYQLLSIERDMTRSGSPDIRLKVALQGEYPHLPTATTVYAKANRSEEQTSELKSLMRISYAVFCMKNKTTRNIYTPR